VRLIVHDGPGRDARKLLSEAKGLPAFDIAAHRGRVEIETDDDDDAEDLESVLERLGLFYETERDDEDDGNVFETPKLSSGKSLFETPGKKRNGR